MILKNRKAIFWISVVCIGAAIVLFIFFSPLRKIRGKVEVYFSPQGGTAEAISGKIDQAKEEIKVAMYIFTSRELAWALVRAKDRGVKISVLLDGEMSLNEFSKAEFLHRREIEVRALPLPREKTEKLMHNKFCLIDQKILLTGSYNWTASAEKRNEENLLALTGRPEIISQYNKRFDFLWNQGFAWEEIHLRGSPAGLSRQLEKKVLSADNVDELRKYAEKEAIVQGRINDIYHSERSNTYFLHFKSGFTAVIFSSAVENFSRQGINIFDYEQRVINLEGRIKDHSRYGLQMIVEDPGQIQVMKKDQ